MDSLLSTVWTATAMASATSTMKCDWLGISLLVIFIIHLICYTFESTSTWSKEDGKMNKRKKNPNLYENWWTSLLNCVGNVIISEITHRKLYLTCTINHSVKMCPRWYLLEKQGVFIVANNDDKVIASFFFSYAYLHQHFGCFFLFGSFPIIFI